MIAAVAFRATLLAAFISTSCGGGAARLPSTTPTGLATASATVGRTPTAAPTSVPAATASASQSPSPDVVATPRPTSTAVPAPTRAPYCAVADELTPVTGYDRHTETYLDWTYRLPDDYAAPDLVSALTGMLVPTPFRVVEAPTAADLLLRRGDPSYTTLLSDDQSAQVRRVAYDDLAAMRAAASAGGVPLVILSAYRSYARQQATFDYWVRVSGYDRALNASARPGHSEHQLGTTIDFGDGTAAPWEYSDWATTPSGAWLRDHAHEYGFVMSYPRGSAPRTCYDYEPWHYRWVGRDLARTIVTSGLPIRVYQAQLR